MSFVVSLSLTNTTYIKRLSSFIVIDNLKFWFDHISSDSDLWQLNENYRYNCRLTADKQHIRDLSYSMLKG